MNIIDGMIVHWRAYSSGKDDEAISDLQKHKSTILNYILLLFLIVLQFHYGTKPNSLVTQQGSW